MRECAATVGSTTSLSSVRLDSPSVSGSQPCASARAAAAAGASAAAPAAPSAATPPQVEQEWKPYSECPPQLLY